MTGITRLRKAWFEMNFLCMSLAARSNNCCYGGDYEVDVVACL